MSNKVKIEMLERLVKTLSGAKDIEYTKNIRGIPYRIRLKDVDPDDVKIKNSDEGLSVDFGATITKNDEWEAKLFGKLAAIVTAEIWFNEDPWKTIDELKDQIKELKRGKKK